MASKATVSRLVFSGIILAAILSLLPVNAMANPELLANFDFDRVDPVKFNAIIMQTDIAELKFIVAERRVHIVDMMVRDYHLKTEITDNFGHPLPPAALMIGQQVVVEGFQYPEGDVVATVVKLIPQQEKARRQKIEKPQSQVYQNASSPIDGSRKKNSRTLPQLKRRYIDR
jgi:hypothetical protein